MSEKIIGVASGSWVLDGPVSPTDRHKRAVLKSNQSKELDSGTIILALAV